VHHICVGRSREAKGAGKGGDKEKEKDAGKGGKRGGGKGGAEAVATSNAWSAEKKQEREERAPKEPRVNKAMLDGVADKLFKALSDGDWDSAQGCFAPAAQCFSPQRSGARAQQFAEFRKTMGGMIGLLGKPQYLKPQRLYGVDSVTEQHTTRFAEKSDTAVEAEACVILRVNPAGAF
jgi:hypothetical protein